MLFKADLDLIGEVTLMPLILTGRERGSPSAATDAGQSERRSSASMVKILEGALRLVGNRGVTRLTMRDICTAAHVSRATLYRHFSTKEEVLDAVTEYICVNFETGVMAAADESADPIERFRAVMTFFSRYARDRSPEPMLELEPGFYLAFFRSHFTRHKIAVTNALARSFDYFEERLGTSLNRLGIAEALIRMQLSTLMVPAESDWVALWDKSPEIVIRLLDMHVAGAQAR